MKQSYSVYVVIFLKGYFELDIRHLLGFKSSGSIGLLAGYVPEFDQSLLKPVVGLCS